ncbi:hypothetical protein ACXX9E_26205 [Pseudomonas sp. GNP014]
MAGKPAPTGFDVVRGFCVRPGHWSWQASSHRFRCRSRILCSARTL